MIKKLFSTELRKGTLILFITINIYNFLNFLFHFVMGRTLGPTGYGTLAVLMSLIYIYGIPSEAIQNIVTKYSSKYNSKSEMGKIRYFIEKAFRKGTKFSLNIFLVMIFVSFFLSVYLGINFWVLILTNVIILFSFNMPIARGVLQGRKKFSKLGASMILESLLKLFFATSFVFFGFKVFGAIMGVVLGIVSSFIFSLYFNKEVLNSNKEKTKLDGIYIKSIPYFMSMFVVFLFFSLDIILAKRFFSPELSGQYAVLSMLGKMIFFGTTAVSKAMFPFTCEKSENQKDSKEFFRKSFFFLSILSLSAVGFYYFIPELIIKILYGEQYLLVAPLLVYSGLALTFLSLTNLNLNYGLSVNRLRKSYYLSIFIIIEVILLYTYHSNLNEYIIAFMVSSIIMFIGSFLFIKGYGKAKNKHNNSCLQ